jgi:hypothetical protein
MNAARGGLALNRTGMEGFAVLQNALKLLDIPELEVKFRSQSIKSFAAATRA